MSSPSLCLLSPLSSLTTDMPFSSTPVDFQKRLDSSKLHGKTALVTGGASGIGAGVVKTLADAGVYVTIADLNAIAGEQYAKTLAAEGHKVDFVHMDVTDWPSQVSAFNHALRASSRNNIDIVIACAGIAGASMLQDPPFTTRTTVEGPQPPSFQLAMINVNLIGSMYTATLAAHHWKQNPPASGTDNILILLASNIAYYPSPGFTGYTASKWGVRGMWKALRATPQFEGLFRTNLLAPHIVRSPMTAGLQPLVEANGFKMTEITDCVECLMRMCCDEEINGRAVEVNPEGSWFDLCDDMEGGDGVRVFNEHHERETKPLFEFLEKPELSMT